MSSIFAFLHHVAAFALVAALAIEFALIRDKPDFHYIRKLAIADMIFGISAGVLLVAGLSRVFYFEKGASYYFHSVPFVLKLALFVIVGLLSIYPTLQFLSWRKSAKRGVLPAIAPEKIRAIRMLIHIELAAVLFLLWCAVLMARGVGQMA